MCRDRLQTRLKISLRSFSADVIEEDPSILIRTFISSHYPFLFLRIKTLNCLNVPSSHVCKGAQQVQNDEASSNSLI